jgi:hypothetical protein
MRATLVPWFMTLVFSTPALSDVILGTGAFQTMVPPTAVGPSPLIPNPNQPPKPYWDQQSIDASNPAAGCNVGWVVTGASLAGCSNVKGPVPFTRDDVAPNAYWALGNGNYDPTFMLHSSAVDGTELELTVTSLTTDIFGWYTVSGSGISRHPLFSSNDLAVASAHAGGAQLEVYGGDIPFNATFGYYLFNGVDTFYTDSSLNTSDIGIQHFALFAAPSTGANSATDYYIGAEDGRAPTDFDYQDMVVHIGVETGGPGSGPGGSGGGPEDPTLAAAPEPGSLFLICTALIGFTLRLVSLRKSG